MEKMTLQESFENIKDERIDRCKKHNLVDILMLVFMGVLCGYKSIEQIQFYATLSEQTLKKYLKLENGIPSSDTILRVLARIDAKQLEKVFIEYARETFGKHIAEDEVLAIDGKTIRRSEYAPTGEDKKPHKAAHIVSAWAHSLGVCFGQVKTEEKSNEITAIPELLDLLDLKGMIITIDAMGCQKKIVEKIAEKEAEYVISLKGNQQSIHRDVKEFFEHPCDDAYCQYYNIQRGEYTIEIGHGRIEKRTRYLCGNSDWLSEKDEWKNLNGVGMLVCERTVKKTGKKSVEQRYFLTSLKDVHKAAFAMRAHWGIENNLHWVLDAILDEDYCLVRKDNAAANLSVLRKIVLNILKQVDFSDIIKAKKMPLLHKQHLCNKREDCLDRVLQSL